MPNPYFKFKQFTIYQDRCAMKVTTDACLFGAWTAAELQNDQASGEALDAGTGTGLLSLMIAQKNNITIDAIEIDIDAAQQAKENIEASKWKEQITVLHDNLTTWKPSKKFKTIITNPPFYESDLRSDKKQKNIAHHDSGLTLQQLFDFIQEYLLDEGTMYLLFPAKREKELDQLLINHRFFIHQKVRVRQTSTNLPFRIMIKAGRNWQPPVTEEIIIKDEDDRYTATFLSLLKDYYLYL